MRVPVIGPHKTEPHDPFPPSDWHAKRMTRARYLKLPDFDPPYHEYIDGVVIQKPASRRVRSRLHSAIGVQLYLYEKAHGGDGGYSGRVYLPLTGDYMVPEVAYWRPGTPSGNDSIPDAVFILADDDRETDHFREKCRRYRQAQGPICFLFEPYERWVEVFDETRDGVRLSPHEPLEASILPGFSLSQAELFAELDR
jgi:Uma2 family endonuclease